MAFWKKPIDLPQTFYRAAGECTLDYMERELMARKLEFRRRTDVGSRLTFAESSSMTFAQAGQLLDLVMAGCDRLLALLAQSPIKSGSMFEVRDQNCKANIQSCDEMKKVISALSDFDRSLPIRQYSGYINGQDAARFEHLIIMRAESLSVDHAMAIKLLAKHANMSSDDFIEHAMQAVKDTPREKLVSAELAQASPSGVQKG